jgi:hypothetical protein
MLVPDLTRGLGQGDLRAVHALRQRNPSGTRVASRRRQRISKAADLGGEPVTVAPVSVVEVWEMSDSDLDEQDDASACFFASCNRAVSSASPCRWRRSQWGSPSIGL